MVEHLKAKLKLLEQLTDTIRQGLTVEDIRKIFSSRNQVKHMKESGEQQKDHDHE
jgi:uncharacterized protein YeeX (DUF496 family)